MAHHHRPAYSGGMVEDAKQRLAQMHAEMAAACKIAGRNPQDVNLIAISKTHGTEAIRPLLQAGHRAFGENRVQEAQEKWPDLIQEFPDITLHLVGQLQSNKAQHAVALFDVIHSVDRVSLVDALASAQEKLNKNPVCFLQINIGNEVQKGGCAVSDLPDLLAHARTKGLNVHGLMAVPPHDLEAAPFFALLAKLARDAGLEHLSMGMSGDFSTAIMLGATHVRVGTALFGSR